MLQVSVLFSTHESKFDSVIMTLQWLEISGSGAAQILHTEVM